MSCGTSEVNSHIPFVKSQLKLLYEVARQTVDSYRGAATDEEIKKYHRYVRKIFTNKRVSFTALNIKSLQCTYLFSLMTKHIPNPDMKPYGDRIREIFYDYLSDIDWTSYDAVLDMILEHEPEEEEADLKWLLIEDEFGGDESYCIPSLKNKAIIVLLGELTLHELVWSLAHDVYFIGLIPKITYADGALMSPISFLVHDLDHMHDRLLLCQADKAGRTDMINARVNRFLNFLADKDPAIQQSCLMFVFLYMHHEIECRESILLENSFIPDSGIFRADAGIDETTFLPARFLAPTDLGGFLPAELQVGATVESVMAWLQSQWLIFIENWAACFTEGSVPPVVKNRPSSDRYRAATLRNAAAWNLMQKRKRRTTHRKLHR
jgi:hypothetical protein